MVAGQTGLFLIRLGKCLENPTLQLHKFLTLTRQALIFQLADLCFQVSATLHGVLLPVAQDFDLTNQACNGLPLLIQPEQIQLGKPFLCLRNFFFDFQATQVIIQLFLHRILNEKMVKQRLCLPFQYL